MTAVAETLPATLLAATIEADVDSSPVKTNAALEYQLVHTTTPTKSISFSAAIEVIVGRDPATCAISFPDVAVLSRQHCRVFTMGRDAFLHDNSSNGTFLNGKLIGKDNKHLLRNGDIIAVVNPKLPQYNEFSWRFVSPDTGDDCGGDIVAATYDLGKVLGTGNFATVRLGTNRRTSEQVAIKIVEKKRFAMQADFSFKTLQSEVDILRRMNHPNIIRVIDVFDTPKAFTLALELVAGGDLFDYIVGRCPKPFTEDEVRQLFVQLVEALLYMHSKDVVHRDLKPENILVHVNPSFMLDYRYPDAQKNAPNIPVSQVTLKVTDFGLAKFCAEQEVMTTMCGTPSYLAPEVRVPGADGKKAQGYSWSVDVWSLGVILYILMSGTPPASPEVKLVFGKQFAGASEAVKSLIAWMLQPDPRTRADLHDIVEHEWLKGIDIKGRHLASKKNKLQLEGTVMLLPQPTVMVAPLPGNVTEGEEGSDDEQAAGAAKRPRDTDFERLPRWQWKADLSKGDNDPTAWKSYDDADNTNIEKQQLRGAKTCKVGNGDYRVSFEGMFQYNKSDTSKQRPIRRILDARTVTLPAAS
jgi:serine/threonine protein kinase